MLASATDSITPSSRHLTDSSASANSIRSSSSRNDSERGSATGGKASLSPGHSPARLPSAYS